MSEPGYRHVSNRRLKALSTGFHKLSEVYITLVKSKVIDPSLLHESRIARALIATANGPVNPDDFRLIAKLIDEDDF